MEKKRIQSVPDYLEISAARFPDKTAFGDGKREMTFAQLREESRRIASVLAGKGLVHRPVAIFMDKQAEVIGGMMGVAYSGNFYTVLDNHMPVARIRKILDTLEPAVVLTVASMEEKAKEFAGDAEVLVYEQLTALPADEAAVESARSRIIGTDTLYVLFTSGSTGTPKGVIISHMAVIEYNEWLSTTFKLDENTVFGNQTPFYFVMSGLDIFQTIRNGCTTWVIPRLAFSFPGMLMSFLQEHHVNTLYWVPSALCLPANLGTVDEMHLPDLRLVMYGGEVMPTKQLNIWRRAYPDVMFVNSYGPTEMTDIITYYIIDREFADNEPIPIGRACSHMDVLVLNDKDELCSPGEIGELCGRGPSLASGYYNEPEKTAAAFVQNPLNKAWPEKIYRTGDLVRVDEYGDLVFVTRKDFQIKHMGHRIELGEIETAVSALEGIERACCLYDQKQSKIVLFYIGTVSGEEIRKELKAYLPDYMIPNRYEQMETMPMNLNGKIDRALLKEKL